MENPQRILVGKISIFESKDEESKALLQESKKFNVKLHKKANSDRDLDTHRSEEIKLSGSDTLGYSEAALISDPISLEHRESSESSHNIRDLDAVQENDRKKFSIKRWTEEPVIPQDSNLNIEVARKPISRSSTIHHQYKGRERTGDLGAGKYHSSVGGPHIVVESFNVRFDESEIQRPNHPQFQSSDPRDDLKIEVVDEDYIPSTITKTNETQIDVQYPIYKKPSNAQIDEQHPIFSPSSNKSIFEKKPLDTEIVTFMIEEESAYDYKTNFQKCVPAGSEERHKIHKRSWFFCLKIEIEIKNESYNTLIWLSQKELDPSDEIQVKIYNSVLREIQRELIGFPATLADWRESFLSDSIDYDPTKGLLLVLLELLFLKQKRKDVYGRFESLSLEDKKIFAIMPVNIKNIVVEYLQNWNFYQKLIAGKPSNLFFTFYTNILNFYWCSLKKKGRKDQQIKKKIRIKLNKNINEFFGKN